MIAPQFVPLLEINIHILIYDQCFPCVLRSDPNMFKVLHTYAWISIIRNEFCFPINIVMIEYNIGHVEFIVKTQIFL
jgi:hypothetical protein